MILMSRVQHEHCHTPASGSFVSHREGKVRGIISMTVVFRNRNIVSFILFSWFYDVDVLGPVRMAFKL